jgi:predicted oxidoreductase
MHGENSLVDKIEIGATGLAYGFWRFGKKDRAAATRMLHAVREAGIVHLDTADIYGVDDEFGATEAVMGEIRRAAPSLFDGASLATKVGIFPGAPYNSSRDYLMRAVDASLRRLACEQVDLLYIHRPDLLAHPEALARSLEELLASGKTKRLAVSNFTRAQVDALGAHLTTPLAATQIEISLKAPEAIEDGRLDDAMARGHQVFAWSPLGGGDLFKSDGAQTALQREIGSLGDAHGVKPSAIALAFLMRHPAAITPIVGTRTPERLTDCLAAASVKLTRTQWYALYEKAIGRKMP